MTTKKLVIQFVLFLFIAIFRKEYLGLDDTNTTYL